jgi:hypothetical protein
MIIVEDWFYDNPEQVYDLALKQEYKTCEELIGRKGFSGKRTELEYVTEEAIDKLSRYFGRQVYPHGNMCGRFQVCTSMDRTFPHTDTDPLAAVVFLDRKQPVNAGTSFYRNKIDNSTENSSEDFNKYIAESGINLFDKTQWEEVARIGLLFNRLVAYPGTLWHDATNYYGHSFESGRLFQVFFLTYDKNQASNVEIIK